MARSLFADRGDFVCGKCKHAMTAGERYCPACGADREVELQVEALERTRLANARRWMLALGFWYVVGALVVYAGARGLRGPGDRMTEVVIGMLLGLAVIQVGLAMWMRQAPLAAAVVSLVLFLSLQIAATVDDPLSLVDSLVVLALKIAFVVVQVKAIRAAYQIHRLRNERR